MKEFGITSEEDMILDAFVTGNCVDSAIEGMLGIYRHSDISATDWDVIDNRTGQYIYMKGVRVNN